MSSWYCHWASEKGSPPLLYSTLGSTSTTTLIPFQVLSLKNVLGITYYKIRKTIEPILRRCQIIYARLYDDFDLKNLKSEFKAYYLQLFCEKKIQNNGKPVLVFNRLRLFIVCSYSWCLSIGLKNVTYLLFSIIFVI